MAGVSIFTQDLNAFDPARARRLDTLLKTEIGRGLDAVYALVWPDYQEPFTPHPQQNRGLFGQWRAEAGVPLWGWLNATVDQADDAEALASLTDLLEPSGWLLDIEGEWTKGAKLTTLIEGAVKTGRPLRASLAAATPSHVEYDYRTLDKHGVAVDWQSYLDSGEGCHPAVAVRELYRSSFVLGGWQYRLRMGGSYGWGRVGRVVGTLAKIDAYQHPGLENADFEVFPREWGWTVASGALLRSGQVVGQLMGRARYPLTRVTLDVTRGADQLRSLDEWTALAASARVPGAAKRPVSIYMGEATSDDVIVAIAKGAP